MKFLTNFRKIILISMICTYSLNFVSGNNQLFDFLQKSETVSNNKSLFENFNNNNKYQKNKQNNNQSHPAIIKLSDDSINKTTKINNRPVVEKVDKIQNIIDIDRKQLSELEKMEHKRSKEQNKELQDMQRKFRLINQKSKRLQNLLQENNHIKELTEVKDQFKNNKAIQDKYIKKFTDINEEINILTKEIEDLSLELSHHEKSNHLEDKISKIPIERVEAEKNLEVQGEMRVESLLTSELRLGNAKFTDNLIEVDNNFKINIGGYKYDINSLNYYNTMMNNFRSTCGEELMCLITKEENKNRIEKEEMIEQSIKSISAHLYALRN